MLSSGNVAVTTNGSGVQANDIRLSTPLTWPTTFELSLDAHRAILVDKSTSITGSGGLSLVTNDGGSGGHLVFGAHGSVQFANQSSELTINGVAYTLVNSITSFAKAVAANPAGQFAFAGSYDASKDGIYHKAPISTELAGSVEGLGNDISGFSLRSYRTGSGSKVALFADVASQGSISDLRLSKAKIKTGRVGNSMIGGLVAYNLGTLRGDRFGGSIEIGDRVENNVAGGLVGFNIGLVQQSSAEGRVHSSSVGDSVGGLVGYSYHGTISQSRAASDVEVLNGGSAGGLLGSGYGTIEESFATGPVKGFFSGQVGVSVGGLTGGISGSISNSYATGSVYGNDAEGGFAGGGENITSSYSTGAASGTEYVGGFLGMSGGGNTDCYWDTTTSDDFFGVGSGSDAGITGLTTAELQSGLPEGFDKKTWAEKSGVNDGLPYLINNPPSK
jgi:hypothetical protein